MLLHRRVTPNIKFAATHLYTWVERGTVRVMCPVLDSVPSQGSNPDHSIRTNLEATTPPPKNKQNYKKYDGLVNLTLWDTIPSQTTLVFFSLIKAIFPYS